MNELQMNVLLFTVKVCSECFSSEIRIHIAYTEIRFKSNIMLHSKVSMLCIVEFFERRNSRHKRQEMLFLANSYGCFLLLLLGPQK